MTTPALTAHADQLAATLRDRRTQHDGEVCDALDLCPSCRAARDAVQAARIPAQRTGER